MDLTPEQLRHYQIFFPHAFAESTRIIADGRRFVHYTSAEVAVSILRKREVWMRRSNVMNDFMEFEHGFECLNAAIKSEAGETFKKLLEGLYPGIWDEMLKRVNEWIPHFKQDTYLTCISEHLPGEDDLGRLSMWRAYGGATGVALVVNNGPFLGVSDALKAYTSPVAYLSKAQFHEQFKQVVAGIVANADYVKNMGHDALIHSLFHMMRFAMLCTKHPGFHEEREWRIIYSPTYEKSDHMIPDLQIVRNIPQPIYKIPLRDIPGEGFVGAEIPALLHRVIIGPTQYPLPMFDAFVSLLKDAGVANAWDRVTVSDIPLRQ